MAPIDTAEIALLGGAAPVWEPFIRELGHLQNPPPPSNIYLPTDQINQSFKYEDLNAVYKLDPILETN